MEGKSFQGIFPYHATARKEEQPQKLKGEQYKHE